jgi:enoyl-CoA hydratase
MPTVILERPADHVAVVRLNRPEAKNALNSELRILLAEYFRQLSDDETVRCIVLTGTAEVFAAGADLREIVDADPIGPMQRRIVQFWKTMAGCPKPVIAAVNGPALGGGCELALVADVIIAGEGAIFGQPEVRLGIMPGGGATQRLMRAIGKYRTMKMLLTGQPVKAREGLEMGFVTDVVADQDVLDTALKMAAQISSLPPLAIRQIKEVVLAGADGSLEAGLMLERRAFELLFSSRDQNEGMRAFLEKRKPRFEGR